MTIRSSLARWPMLWVACLPLAIWCEVACAATGTQPLDPLLRREAATWWHQHRAIAYKVTWDLDRNYVGAELLAGDAPAAVVESLQAALRGWSLPPRTWPSQQRPEYVRTVVFATDRTAAASGDSAVHIPTEVRAVLARAPLDCWMAAMRAADPRFSADDLTAGLSGALRPSQTPAPSAAFAARREGCASVTLSASPQGRWVLDPFAHLELSCLNPPATTSVNLGYAIHDAGTGEEVCSEFTGRGIALGGWLDDTRCVLAGESEIVGADPAAFVARVPTLWVVDVERHTRTRFQGVPASPHNIGTLERAVVECLQKAYPGVRFE
jgi:hypothetical protein